MTIHRDPHPLTSQIVTLKDDVIDPRKLVTGGTEYWIEDWWDRVSGRSWTISDGNQAAMHYAMRIATADIPLDDDVLYGKIGSHGHLVHVTEIKDAGGAA